MLTKQEKKIAKRFQIYDKLNLTNEDIEDLIIFLEEYLKIFKNKQEHQKAHKKEPCPKCELAKRLLKKLKNGNKS
jgi:hypothetical protein